MKLTDEFPKHLCLIGIQPESLESGIGLTETIQNVLPKVFETLNQVIKEYGLTAAIQNSKEFNSQSLIARIF